jgi:hypothetical protein
MPDLGFVPEWPGLFIQRDALSNFLLLGFPRRAGAQGLFLEFEGVFEIAGLGAGSRSGEAGGSERHKC